MIFVWPHCLIPGRACAYTVGMMRNWTKPMHERLIALTVIVGVAAGTGSALADADKRTLVVRERTIVSLLGGDFVFKLLRMRGYSIDVSVAGQRRALKFGDAIMPPGADCQVVFEEISPETRIARFVTDCP